MSNETIPITEVTTPKLLYLALAGAVPTAIFTIYQVYDLMYEFDDILLPKNIPTSILLSIALLIMPPTLFSAFRGFLAGRLVARYNLNRKASWLPWFLALIFGGILGFFSYFCCFQPLTVNKLLQVIYLQGG